ncbi:TVP38/TMEM64 family protein [Aquibium oceanicum]|uniref:TVP38/TMEM64 family protein n=1 Tax=Aquibium oceanicum TaxID=1670800 RepID=UPI0009FAA2EB
MQERNALSAASEKIATREGHSRLWRFLPIALIIAGLAAGYAAGLHEVLSLDYLSERRDQLHAFVADNYLSSLIGFLLVYALAVALAFPAASILTVFAGLLFGWLVGGALVAVAATLGATALFLAARSAFGDVLRNRLGQRAARLAAGFEEDAFGYLLVLRLAPIFPFWVINIAPAFFQVPLRTYVLATFIGILPGTFAYAYFGEGLESVLVAADQSGQDIALRDLITPEITIAFVALALVAAIPTVVKKLRNRKAD